MDLPNRCLDWLVWPFIVPSASEEAPDGEVFLELAVVDRPTDR